MIDLTKRLLSNLSISRGLLLMRFPWSLVSIPLVLLGWYHFSDQATEKGPHKGMETAGMTDGTSYRNQGGNRPGQITPVAGIEAASAGPGQTEDEGGTDAENAGPSGARDANARCRTKIVGNWEDDYQGKRHLTVNEDGSGTMVVELDGIGKKLFAARLSFDLEWSLADGRVTMKTLGGEPKAKVQLVLKLYGSEADYKILELTDDRMLLLDGDGKTKYDWRRPGATAAQ